ncbi:hypothetical protein JCM10213v2_005829 [Rhodosporidiobolus nylandii]
MASTASPLASFTTTLPTPLQVRPSVPQRTPSARTLPTRSTLPAVQIVLPTAGQPEELKAGLFELAKHAVRGNVRVVDDEGQVGGGEETWVVRFAKREDFPVGAMKIECSHDDFTTLSSGEEFSIRVSYNRPIEAYRALGHILGISRGLASFTSPSSATPDVPSRPASAMDTDGSGSGGGTTPVAVDGVNGEGGSEGAIRWSGNVGAMLRREEQCLFRTVGVMIDCSRNGVLRVESTKMLLRQLALMGSNMLQLYCEDTYQIPGEPFFGGLESLLSRQLLLRYFRGPYSQEELKEIDDCAFSLGIEVIPCIQTLGHLGQMLQWPKYGHLRDTAEVLLAESEETYTFIEKMIRSISTPLRSRRIHIGMDEAHGVSEGRYRQLFGFKEGTQVFVDHLRRVNRICLEAGLEPMIWSDMLFCLPAKNNALSGYYDPNSVVTEDLARSFPDEVSTVFWECIFGTSSSFVNSRQDVLSPSVPVTDPPTHSYYHTDSRPYTAKIAQHWQLAGKAPFMASGVWTWSRFWTALPFTFATIRASMKASKEASAGVQHVMTTIWGDEGNEVDLYSALPGMLYQAELAYGTCEQDEVDAALLRRKFDGIVGADLDDYVYASKLDDTQPESQPIDSRTHYTPNLAKYLLWEEPFFSFLSPQYRGYDLESHYSALARYLEQALSSSYTTMSSVSAPHSIESHPANKRLRLPYLLANVLSLKCHLRERLVLAYKAGDREELEALGGESEQSRMSRLRKLVKELHKLHRANWFALYKPFGFEVLDLRYGGLESRLETMHERLIGYLKGDGSVERIEELEVELEVIYPNGHNLMLDYARCSRPQYV